MSSSPFALLMRFSWLLAFLLVGLSTGCGEERELREWRPEDHGQPEPAEVDPTRVRAGQTGAGQPAEGTATERAAAALWNVRCRSCHGLQGRGDGPDRPPTAQMPDFTSAEWQQSKSDDELLATIRDGRGEMPEFGTTLNQQGIAAMVQHVRSYAPDGGDGEAETGANPGP